MQWAPLVDAALGPVAQHVVLRDNRVLELLEAGTFRLAGRVGFLSLADVRGDPRRRDARSTDAVGVLGRLDRTGADGAGIAAAGAAAAGTHLGRRDAAARPAVACRRCAMTCGS